MSPSAVPDACSTAAALLGPRARRHVPLGPLTTYRVGGAASLFVEALDREDLEAVAAAVRATDIPVLVVGRGSNLLVADEGFPGLAVVLGGAFAAIELDDGGVRAGGAVALPVLARRCTAEGMRGLEGAVGVPGTVGGAVRMNAGGHGADVAGCLRGAAVFDLEGMPGAQPGWRTPAELALGYRSSGLGPRQIVVEAVFVLAPGSRAEGEAQLAEIVRWRRANQPGGANAGSVFANPPGDSAGRLIEAAGLKGHRRGSAFVSPRHANFFQADQVGSAGDVAALIDEVRTAVAECFGVELVPEVRLVGFEQPSS